MPWWLWPCRSAILACSTTTGPPPGEGLAATCVWAMEHLAEPLTVAGLGTATNLRLHLARDAGTTPTAYRAAYQGHQPVSHPRTDQLPGCRNSLDGTHPPQ